MKITDSIDYSSDSSFEDYYLHDEEERKLRDFADRCLVSACEAGDMPWDSDPAATADFLREINEKYGWNIPIDMDDIKRKLANKDKKIKKMSRLYQKLHNADPEAAKAAAANEEPPPEENGADEAAAVGGRDASVLFIRRSLNKTDVSDHQNRLSMPCSQVNDGILTSEEKKRLQDNMPVAAKLIDPGNKTYDINLRLTAAGPTTSSYAIGKPWNMIKRKNGFQAAMVLDVRGFRGDRGELCFLLERVG